CQSGAWKKSSGSAVLTGSITHGQQIPIPDGFSEKQCQWSVSNSENPHGWKPEYYAGSVAIAGLNRIVTCGYFDEYNFHAGTNRTDISGKCSYIISCS
ncbi:MULTISPECIES: shufflon protein D', partial [Pectobacterium]|uniref:shufflon protein D' n=1 Tax=Pectobacterium TaxID=122277 RepID=UPI001F0806B3